jgi:hypothetical protein
MISGVSSVAGDGTLTIAAARASSLAPSAGGVTVALGPRAGIGATYLRTDDTFDASYTTLVTTARPDSADGTQSAIGSSVCETFRVSCGVRVAEWAAVGLSVGAQASRARVRVSRRETLLDPPGAPPTAVSRYENVHDVRVSSRTTPLVAWGAAFRPAPFLDVDVSSRPSVTMRYSTVVSQLTGLTEVFYPSNQLFSSNRFTAIVSPGDARGRSDADVSVIARARPHDRVAAEVEVTHVTTYPIDVDARGAASAVDRLIVEEPHRSDLWRIGVAVRATRVLTARAQWEHVLRAGWDVDGRRTEEERLPSIGGGVDLALEGFSVRVLVARCAGDVAAVLPHPPVPSAATQRISDVRVTTAVEWR